MAFSAASRFFSYHRLSKDDYPPTPDDAAPFRDPSPAAAPARPPGARWTKLRRSGSSGRGAGWWRPRRPRVRVAGLRRLLGRKARLLRGAVRKVVQRFREGRAHLGDLFAGNYLFLQVNPVSAAAAAKHSAYLQQAQRPPAAATMRAGAAASSGFYGVPPAAAGRYYLPYGLAA